MRLFAVCTLAVALLEGIAPPVALACRCVPSRPTSWSYRRAHVAIIAKVVGVSGDIDKPEGAVAKVEVSRTWKAPVAQVIRISTATTCAFDFHEGEEYLLFLDRASDGGYSTSKCVGNEGLGSARRALRWLEQHGQARRVGGD